MAIIPLDVLGGVMGFSDSKTILISFQVSHFWENSLRELYGKWVYVLQKILRPIIVRIPEDRLEPLLSSIGFSKKHDFLGIVGDIGPKNLRYLEMAVCFHTGYNSANKFLFDLNVQSTTLQECGEFFADLIHGDKNLGEIMDNKLLTTFDGSYIHEIIKIADREGIVNAMISLKFHAFSLAYDAGRKDKNCNFCRILSLYVVSLMMTKITQDPHANFELLKNALIDLFYNMECSDELRKKAVSRFQFGYSPVRFYRAYVLLTNVLLGM
jgi:hypothetical protein